MTNSAKFRLSSGPSARGLRKIDSDHSLPIFGTFTTSDPAMIALPISPRVLLNVSIQVVQPSHHGHDPSGHPPLGATPDPLMCAGIPVNFSNITIQWADLPRPIQSGDIVIAK